MPADMIRLEHAVVSFDGFKALDVDAFSVREREMRVVIGPNGAGKTTLCDVISGKTRLTSGRCCVDGTDVAALQDYEIARRGVGRKFQTPSVFGSLTVAENLDLARPARSGSSAQPEIRRMAELTGLAPVIDTAARLLSHGQRQLLEIAMVLIAKPKLLLIDEPAAGLSDAEAGAMVRLLIDLAGQHTVIVIEHDMDFVRELRAGITVLHEGRVLAEGPMSAIQADPRVVDVYLGR
jgi:urea transport system ATP-binding protein